MAGRYRWSGRQERSAIDLRIGSFQCFVCRHRNALPRCGVAKNKKFNKTFVFFSLKNYFYLPGNQCPINRFDKISWNVRLKTVICSGDNATWAFIKRNR